MKAFNTKTAGRVTGASQKQLIYWDKTGLVKPSVAGASGRGSRRLYSFLDLVQIRVAKELRERGLSLQKLRKAIHVLKEHPEEVRHPLAELRLITDGKALFRLTSDPEALEDILKRGQLVSALAIKPQCDYVRQRVAKTIRKAKEKVDVMGKTYTVLVEADVVDGGFIAECPALPGCVTDGETPEAAVRNAREAIADWLAAGEGKHLAKAE
ncbi:MAG: MerR family transcriptional regulator [Phycisphaerae bacterium]|nr:MerR family transcriptional regulator [Phycisphaerae bacterium]